MIWQALSPLAVLAGVSGIGLMAVVFFSLVAMPGWLSRPLMVVGGVLAGLALVYQAGFAMVTKAAAVRAVEIRAEANLKRAQAAEEAIEADQARRMEAEEALRTLQKEVDETPANPGACLDRDASQRLQRVR